MPFVTAPSSVAQYCQSVPDAQRPFFDAIRAAVNQSLPEGYEEGIQYRMLGWYVPHTLFPRGYHCDPKQPLPFAALAAKKDHLSLHLLGLYMLGAEHPLVLRFQASWLATGKKLDMGKGCVRMRSLDDVPMAVLCEMIRSLPVADYVAHYEAAYGSKLKSVAKTADGVSAARRAKAAVRAGSATKKTAK